MAPRQFDAGRLMAPKEIPKQIAIIRRGSAAPPWLVAWSAAFRAAFRAARWQ